MSSLAITGTVPVRAPDTSAARTSSASRPAAAERPAAPRPDIEVQKSRFEVPPGQVLVVDAGAAPGEGRVTLETKAPDTGSLLDVKY